MFIRATTTKNRKTGATYITHRLVETIQTEKGPRQRIVMSIGKLDLAKNRWKELSKALEHRLAGSENFAPEDIQNLADVTMKNQEGLIHNRVEKEERHHDADVEEIDLNSVNSAHSRSVGPEIVCCSTWNLLGLDEILSDQGFSKKEISWVKIVVMGRLIEPGSDAKTWVWYHHRSSLSEFLPEGERECGRNSIYEIADLLLEKKETLEKVLYQKTVVAHNISSSIFLFDLTNLYFEGQCKGNDLAKFGKSKEKRSDCRLVTLALMVDQNGFPIGSKIYKGNQSEVPTLNDILEECMPRYDEVLFPIKPTIIMDRGIATKANINRLKKLDFHYVVIERSQDLSKYIDDFKGDRHDFIEIKRKGKDSVWAKTVKKENDDEGDKIICVSEPKMEKEKAMVSKREERFLSDIARLEKSISKGNIKKPRAVSERLGRLKERYGKVANFYEVTFELNKGKDEVTSITYTRQSTIKEATYGCYSIETSHGNLQTEEIWRLYMTLTRVESSFRSLKTDLGTRPIFHQLAHRTSGHLFISVLAYHLLISIESRLAQKGVHLSWKSIRELLSTHQRQTIMMTNTSNEIIHIRVTGQPESFQKEIYDFLDIKVDQQRLVSRVGFRL